jgi:hypothetical protein
MITGRPAPALCGPINSQTTETVMQTLAQERAEIERPRKRYLGNRAHRHQGAGRDHHR